MIFERLRLQMKVKLKQRNGGLEGGWGSRSCDTGEATLCDPGVGRFVCKSVVQGNILQDRRLMCLRKGGVFEYPCS